MRKVLCLLMALATFMLATAQDHNYIKPATITINISATDFKTPASMRGMPLPLTYGNFNFKNMWSGLGGSYLKGISNNIDFVGSLNGTFVYYPFHNSTAKRTRHLLLAGDVGFNIKMFSDNRVIVPYVSAAIGAYCYNGVTGMYSPLGVGLQFNINRKTYIFLNAQYRLPITTEANYHYFFSLGGGIPLTKKANTQPRLAKPKKSLPEIPTNEPVVRVKPVVVDTDGDGIIDSLDKCPTIPGLAKYKGCPIPDTDGDGVNDEEDRCPTVLGLVKYQGCPIPDTDGDGVNDELDKCPTVPGPVSNKGCPIKVVTEEMSKKVEMAAKEIYFETSNAVLLPKSFPKLDAVVAIMNANETVKIEIDGHTDNVGKLETNQLLSESRAAAVAAYLASKGIAAHRLVSKGFGQTMPIDTNATPAGRAKNRRVEMKISD